MSTSLPLLTPLQNKPKVPPNGTFPHEEEIKAEREIKGLRNRNKELESELRRTTAALQKTRQLAQMREAYGREPPRMDAWADDDGKASSAMKKPLKGSVDAAVFAKAQVEWESELKKQKEMYEQRIASANKMHAQELAQYKGGDKEDAIAAINEQARKERVDLLKRQIARRMLNRELTRGWQCWVEMYEARVYAKKRLRECAQRLKAPEVAEAFGYWLRAYENTLRIREVRAAEERAREALGNSESLQEEVERLKRELDAAKDEKEKALERQLIEITGSHEQRLAMEAEKAKEERVELLRRQFGRRMMNRDLSAGWDAWVELWRAKTYALQRLREVGNRFRAPELSNAFAFWQSDFIESQHRAEKIRLEKQSESLEAQLRQALFEVGQAGMVNVALSDEIKGLKEQVAELTESSKSGKDSMRSIDELKKQVEELNADVEKAEAEAGAAEQRRIQAEEDAARQRQEDKKLLEKLLADQRKAFDEQLEGFRAEVEAEKDAKAKEERIELLRRQITRRMMNREITRGWQHWHDFYQAKTYAENRLREVGNRFRRPELAQAFTFWVWLTEMTGERKKFSDATKRIDMLGKDAGKALSLQEQNDQLRGELEEATLQLDKLREQLRIIDGGASEAAAMHAAQMEKEKEERVELLHRQIGRRMMYADLGSAWAAWLELWTARTYAMERLRKVSMRFRKPELSMAFAFWEQHWNATKAAKLERAHAHSVEQLASEGAKVAELTSQLAAAQNELEELREKLSGLDGGAAEMTRLHQEQLQQEREERVELLRRQIGRRMISQEMARGWQCWYEFWSGKTYAMQRLRGVGNRLRAPELQHAFKAWDGYVQKMYNTQRIRELRAQAGGEQAKAIGLAGQLEELRAEMRAKLAAAEEDKRAALQRQMVELTGSSAQQMALDEEKAREERVELVRRQFARRMVHRDLASGWSAWVLLWEAKIYAKNRLRQIANRFKSPKLMIAFEHWAQTTYDTLQQEKLAAAEALRSKLEGERMELSGQMAAMKAEYEAKLRRAEEGRVLLLEKVALLGGIEADAEAALEAQRALDKEKRVELLTRQIGRRMLNTGLVRGWTAWYELWRARREALTVLRLVGNRFKAPALAEAFAIWVEMRAKKLRLEAERKRLVELRGETDRLENEVVTTAEQLHQTRMEMQRKLRAAEDEKRTALQRQMVELTGSAEERLALAAQKEKEGRVELLRRQVTRRMMNRDITRGWQCWREMFEAKTYAKGRLQQCAQKLKSPELADAFEFWFEMVQEAKQQLHVAHLEKMAKSLEAQLRQARHEAGQANLIKIANADEITALRDKLNETSNEVKDREARIAILRGYEREAEELRLTQQAALDAQKIAVEKLAEAEEDNLKQREADKELLERLLAEQRRDFMEEQDYARKQLKAQADERKAYEDQITDIKREQTIQLTEFEKKETSLNEEISKLKAEIVRLRKPPPVKVRATPGVRPSPLGKIDLDEGPDAPPISQQLAAALKKNSARVLDLFRSWDADGDGEVTRKEFHLAMPKLGLDVPKKDIDELFTEWDKDGGGALNLRELQKILQQAKNTKPAEKVQEAATTAMATMNALSAFKKKVGGAAPAVAPQNGAA